MTTLRQYLMRHTALAAWLVVLTLLMKMLVPTGYMFGTSSTGSITIELCSGFGPVAIAAPRHGMTHHHGQHDHKGKEMPPCAFSGLSAASLGGTDPLLLALAIAFIVTTVFLSVVPSAVVLPTYLRPPLRGPPRYA